MCGGHGYEPAYLAPPAYPVTLSLRAGPPGACEWTVVGLGGRAVAETAPCDAPFEADLPVDPGADRPRGAAMVRVTRNGAVLAAERVTVEDVLILAIGDSFAAGEGNPDVPADLAPLFAEDHLAEHSVLAKTLSRPNWPGRIDGEDVAEAHARPAAWWDAPCRRSLLSWPVAASMKYAADHPDRAVTLVHLACSGGEIEGGLLGPQERDDGPDEAASQIDQFLDLVRRSGRLRPVDQVFLSVGGNDIGFAGVISYAVLPPNGYRLDPFGWIAPRLVGWQGGAVAPHGRMAPPLSRLEWPRRSDAETRRKDLARQYDALWSRLRAEGIAPPPSGGRPGIVQPTYPKLLTASFEDGTDAAVFPCRSVLRSSDYDDAAFWTPRQRQAEIAFARASDPARAADPVWPTRDLAFESLSGKVEAIFQRRTWTFQLRYAENEDGVEPCSALDGRTGCSEVHELLAVQDRLRETVRANGHRPGTAIAASHEAASARRGWCGRRAGAPFALPTTARPGAHARLLAWNPYDAGLGRWVRTKNDSAITQWAGPKAFHHGTIHPTFRGHLEIADAVYRTMMGRADAD